MLRIILVYTILGIILTGYFGYFMPHQSFYSLGIIYAADHLPTDPGSSESGITECCDPSAPYVIDLPPGAEPYTSFDGINADGSLINPINHLPSEDGTGGDYGEGGEGGEGGDGCPLPSYPTDNWDRVWCNAALDTHLADTPNESVAQFNTNWGTGSVGGIRNDDIGFRSGRVLNLPLSGVYTFSVGSDDGVRVWIDGVLVLDRWSGGPYSTDNPTRTRARRSPPAFSLWERGFEDSHAVPRPLGEVA